MKKTVALVLCLILMLSMVGCQKNQSDTKDSTKTDGAGKSNVILTVSKIGESSGVEYTKKQLKNLGTEKVTYSGRNKTNNSERISETYEGIKLKKLLKESGFEDAQVIKITCSDGYTKEYQVEDLYGLKFFEEEKATKGTDVEPMIAIVKDGTNMSKNEDFDPKDGSPLRLVYGQEDYDSSETKDFNMQGWAAYVEKIEVEE